jgi:pimeloyl-ACP methyl ester carboxylesterase
MARTQDTRVIARQLERTDPILAALTESFAVGQAAASIESFGAELRQSDLDDLHGRLLDTRWAVGQPAGAGSGQCGFPLDRLRGLVGRWLDVDWRWWAQRLNAYPQYWTEIDGQPVHFLHIRSGKARALPVILSHGWPGSVFEYIGLIDRLTNPVGFGGEPGDAFDVVLPSLPGYGFSGPAMGPDWGMRRIAQAWAELMARLGCERYGAIGR